MNKKLIIGIAITLIIVIIGVFVFSDKSLSKEEFIIYEAQLVQDAVKVYLKDNAGIMPDGSVIYYAEKLEVLVADNVIYDTKGKVKEIDLNKEYFDITNTKIVKDLNLKGEGIYLVDKEFDVIYIDINTNYGGDSTLANTDSGDSTLANSIEDDFVITNDGEIIEYIGNDEIVTIPSIIDSIEVEIIEENVFKGKDIKEVIIPEGVKEIKNQAFIETGIERLVLPNSLEIIGDSVFFGNNITELIIPDSVISIGDSAFADNNISSIKFGKNLLGIKGWAFQGNNFETLEIPEGIRVGRNAFIDCGIHILTLNNGIVLDEGVFASNPIITLNLNGDVEGVEDAEIAYNWTVVDNFVEMGCTTKYLCKIKNLDSSVPGVYTMTEEITNLEGMRAFTSMIIHDIEYIKEPVEIGKMKTFILK